VEGDVHAGDELVDRHCTVAVAITDAGGRRPLGKWGRWNQKRQRDGHEPGGSPRRMSVGARGRWTHLFAPPRRAPTLPQRHATTTTFSSDAPKRRFVANAGAWKQPESPPRGPPLDTACRVPCPYEDARRSDVARSRAARFEAAERSAAVAPGHGRAIA